MEKCMFCNKRQKTHIHINKDGFRKMRNKWILFGIGFVLVFNSGCGEGLEGTFKQKKFGPVFNDFILNEQSLTNFKPKDNKAICYNLDKKIYTHQFIPEEYYAKEPEEVRFILTYTFEKFVYGFYKDGTKGFRSICNFNIYDTTTSSHITSFSLMGDPPPDTKRGFGDTYGRSPGHTEKTDEVVTEYIENIIHAENYWEE